MVWLSLLIAFGGLCFALYRIAQSFTSRSPINEKAARFYQYSAGTHLTALVVAAGMPDVLPTAASLLIVVIGGYFFALAYGYELETSEAARIENVPNTAWHVEHAPTINSFTFHPATDTDGIINYMSLIPESLRFPVRMAILRYLESIVPADRDTFLAQIANDSGSAWDFYLEQQLEAVSKYRQTVAGIPHGLIDLAYHLPHTPLLALSPDGTPWREYLPSKQFFPEQLPEELAEKILSLPLSITLPPASRIEHHHIIAGSGHGKTTLLESMIFADMQTDASIVVIDSQGEMLPKLMKVAPLERLVVVDPTDIEYPVALNLFDIGLDRIEQYSALEREKAINGVIELYDFVMASLLGAEMTSKQSTAFRYVTRLMLTVPGATIQTLRSIFEPGGLTPHQEYVEQLGATAQSFFQNEFNSREFEPTKRQILRRLYGILENQTFERMFTNPKSKLDIFEEMNAGKIILINTAADLLKADGSQIMGRFFIAMIAQAAQERASLHSRRRTYLYIDEAHEYFDDTMVTILTKARKYELGLIIAHQFLGQFPPKLAQAVAANTSIKFAGGLSSQDARTMASQMFTRPEEIQAQPKGTFLAYVRNVGTFPYTVSRDPLRRAELASTGSLSEIRLSMRRQYSGALLLENRNRVRTPRRDPDDVPEAGTW